MTEHNPESHSQEHPVWEGAVVGFLGAIEGGYLKGGPNEVITLAGSLIAELMQMGLYKFRAGRSRKNQA
jgi:hypothetical protein